jgi:hypothetical protein
VDQALICADLQLLIDRLPDDWVLLWLVMLFSASASLAACSIQMLFWIHEPILRRYS